MVTHFAKAVVVLFSLFVANLDAQQVHFDVSRTVACQSLHTDGASTADLARPGRKLVQARVSVSVLAHRGEAKDITECLYRFDNASSTTQVVDYLPRTTMDTNVAGNIQVQQSTEAADQVNLSVSAGFESIRANGGGSKSDSTRAAFEYELIPPQEMVAAVGTTGRGTGVYFKLRRTPQISLEGSREFLITLRVPNDWRGGYFRATCKAVRQTNRGETVLGASTFVVPLYLADDVIARRLAENFSDAEQQLYTSARKHQHDVLRRSLPTIAHELSLVDPKIPATWLQQVVSHHSVTDTKLGFERRLPTEVQAAIANYREARLGLTSLRKETVAAASPRLHQQQGVRSDADVYVRADAWRARAE